MASSLRLSSLCFRPYLPGFRTIIESDTFPKGLDEDVVRAISVKKNEPEWMLDFRLKAFRRWLTMAEPQWSDNTYVLLCPILQAPQSLYIALPSADWTPALTLCA